MAHKRQNEVPQNPAVIIKHALTGFGHLIPTVTWCISHANSGPATSVASYYLDAPPEGLDMALLYGLPMHIYGLSPCEVMSKRQSLLSTFCAWAGTRYGCEFNEPTGNFNMHRLLKPTQRGRALHMCIASRYALALNASKTWRIVQASGIWQRNS